MALSRLRDAMSQAPDRVYWCLLSSAFLIAVVLRVPATVQELPPFQFCDEVIFSAETQRMIVEHSWVTKEFRSGGLNIYPMVLLGRALHLNPAADPTALVVLGRWCYSVLLSSLAVIPVAAAARVLSRRRLGGLIAAGLFLLSPSLLAVSRYWYPDHWAALPSAALVLLLVVLLRSRLVGIQRSACLTGLGAVLGAAISLKYTFTVAALPIALALVGDALLSTRASPIRRLGRLLLDGVLVVAAAAVVVVVLNFSAVVDPQGFIAGFKFNIDNYSRPGGSAEGILFYAFLLLVAAFGLLGVVGLVAGVPAVWSRDRLLLVVLLSFPLFNVIYLGTQGLVFNRNIIASIPFILPILAVGVLRVLAKICTRRSNVRSGLIAAGLMIVVAVQGVQIVGNFVADLQPDSEPIATAWIDRNIPRSSVVGINPACSTSPAQSAGRQVQVDPDLRQGLPYYVINSYWSSGLNPAFRESSAAAAIFNQKYLHFYYPSDRALPFDVLRLPWRIVPLVDVVPSGYRVVEEFDSNGPTIVVLKRVG